MRSDSGKRTYIITANRMISGLVLKYLKGERFVMPRGDGARLEDARRVYLTVPTGDIPHIIDIAKEFHAESRYSHLPFSEEKLMRVFARAINHPNDIFAVYVLFRGEIVGVLHAGIGDYYLGVGGRMVTIYSYYISRKIRASYLGGKVAVKLLRLVTDWARAQEADEMHIHSTSGIEPQKADRMLRRMGFETVGGSYAARLV